MPKRIDDLSDIPENYDELPGFNDYHPSAEKPISVSRHESVPDEVNGFFEEMQSAKEYICTLYRNNDGKRVLVTKLRNQIPDNHEIGIKYGPGDYTSVFSWTVPGRKTPDTRKLVFSIGEDYMVLHRQYLDKLRQEQTLTASPNQSINEAIDLFAKMAPLLNQGKNDNSVILEMVREQNNATREMFREMRDQMKDLAHRTDSRFEMLLQTISVREKPKSLLEQLEEMRVMKSMIGEIGNENGDNRPVWLQVVDSIGDRVAPLLDALSKGGFRAKVAESQVRQGLNTDLGRKLLADREQQKMFISEMLKKAQTEEAKTGILQLAQNLRIQIPENV